MTTIIVALIVALLLTLALMVVQQIINDGYIPRHTPGQLGQAARLVLISPDTRRVTLVAAT